MAQIQVTKEIRIALEGAEQIQVEGMFDNFDNRLTSVIVTLDNEGNVVAKTFVGVRVFKNGERTSTRILHPVRIPSHITAIVDKAIKDNS